MRQIFMIVLTALVAGPALAQSAPAPGSVAITALSANGNGCPAGTTASNVAPDNLAFTVLFSAFQVEGAARGPDGVRSCTVNLTIQIPAGWQFSVFTADTRGF